MLKKLSISLLCLFPVLGISLISGQKRPTGVEFQEHTITRKGNFGDNWCLTWASDDNIYTMLDDGNGWWGSPVKSEKREYNQGSMCIRIKGNADFSDDDVEMMPG